MSVSVLVRPIVTEKSTALSEGLNKYSFVVNRKANKLQIRNAVETMYGVKVTEVKTMVMPAKDRSRFTNSGYTQGVKSAYKKAVVSLADGETIDFYSNI